VLYIYWNYTFLIILQDDIGTVTVENVEERDPLQIETEEGYIQLERTIKTEEEVSVVCQCVLW
jgi:hypothetical protein